MLSFKWIKNWKRVKLPILSGWGQIHWNLHAIYANWHFKAIPTALDGPTNRKNSNYVQRVFCCWPLCCPLTPSGDRFFSWRQSALLCPWWTKRSVCRSPCPFLCAAALFFFVLDKKPSVDDSIRIWTFRWPRSTWQNPIDDIKEVKFDFFFVFFLRWSFCSL